MKFLHTDLGVVAGGSVVVVRLSGTEANVLLLDDSNLASYRRGQRCQYHGGHFTRSPARIVVPTTGRWNVIVDLGGYVGTINASVEVLAA